MANLLIKKAISAVPAALAHRELGIAQDVLYYGNSSNKPIGLSIVGHNHNDLYNTKAEVSAISTRITNHENNGSNPHQVTPVSLVTRELSTASSIDLVARRGINTTRSNKTYGLSASAIVVEYSEDDGVTWVDYGATDLDKQSLFNERRDFSCYCGRKLDKPYSIKDKLRVTIEPIDRYVTLDEFYAWISTNGARCFVDLERSLYTAKDTFTKVFSAMEVGGWFGNNYKYFSGGTFGGTGTGRHYKYRLTFYMTAIGSTTYPFCIQDIRFYGHSTHSRPNTNPAASNMVYNDHIYSISSSYNVRFPYLVYENNSESASSRLVSVSHLTSTMKTLTFTGAVSGTYNPMTAATINIPTIAGPVGPKGADGISITGATSGTPTITTANTTTPITFIRSSGGNISVNVTAQNGITISSGIQAVTIGSGGLPWQGSGPYTINVSKAVHGRGDTKDMQVTFLLNDGVALQGSFADYKINNDYSITITVDEQFNGKALISSSLAPSVVATWGNITGSIDAQTDLINKINAKAATWGNITGTLTLQTDLVNYINSKSLVSNPAYGVSILNSKPYMIDSDYYNVTYTENGIFSIYTKPDSFPNYYVINSSFNNTFLYCIYSSPRVIKIVVKVTNSSLKYNITPINSSGSTVLRNYHYLSSSWNNIPPLSVDDVIVYTCTAKDSSNYYWNREVYQKQ